MNGLVVLLTLALIFVSSGEKRSPETKAIRAVAVAAADDPDVMDAVMTASREKLSKTVATLRERRDDAER
ncbi:MAG: hypothetical protein LW855_05075 [Alphaproteobacteria bacterium]|jgi:hypothetical protein|nr:hypothetical protein [Thalassospira sp.]MCE2965145.1 hypothetical protein [Alphaproteobacteria bacterium]